MIIVAWVVQLIGLVGSAGFIVTYATTVWQPWHGRRPAESERERAARQQLLSLPVALLALLTPGVVYTLLGYHNALFSDVGVVAGKAIAVSLLWFPWRLYLKARKADVR
jgi:arginine exporter protein ArgO